MWRGSEKRKGKRREDVRCGGGEEGKEWEKKGEYAMGGMR